MGFNTYNYFGENYDDATIRQITDAMVSSGMKDVGYHYVNLDGAWDSGRDANGNFIPDPIKFPNGIRALADYVHSKGLKFGIYTSAGPKTCGSTVYPQTDYTTRDAQQFASWGVDFIKVDGCFNDNQQAYYTNFRNAIAATGRPMLLSINAAYNNTGFETWSNPSIEQVANLTRNDRDIVACWNCTYNFNPGVLETFDLAANPKWNNRQQPGHWIDPDMLEVGVVNGFTSAPNVPALTLEENRSHFSMWAMLSAPLIVGLDVRSMSNEIKNILINPEVIAVDQDTTGRGVKVREDSTGLQVWSKRLSGDGQRAVMLLNRNGSASNITVRWSDLGLQNGSASVRDLWARTDRGNFTDAYTVSVPSNGVAMLRVSGTEANTNLARTATVQSSSSLENFGWGNSKANDGQRSTTSTSAGWTSYSSISSNHTEWLQFTLTDTSAVSRVDLFPRNDAGQIGNGFPIDFTIQIASDSSCATWTTVVTRKDYGKPTNTVQSFGFSPVTARCVRVTGTNLRQNPSDNNNYYMQFAEVEIAVSAGGSNLITNPSFQAEGATSTPSGWETGGDADADYTETFGARDGSLHGTHYRSSAYAVYTSQLKTGLADGLYTVRAWVKGGGGNSQTAQLEVKDFGGTQVNLPVNSADWTRIERRDINVTNGQARVGFYSVASGGQGMYFDDVEFFKQ